MIAARHVLALFLILMLATFAFIAIAGPSSQTLRSRIDPGHSRAADGTGGGRKIMMAKTMGASTSAVQLPSATFDRVSREWASLEELIIVPGHAIQWCTERGGTDLLDESCWYLLEYQRGQIPIFLEHIKQAVQLAQDRPNSLLVFSGGQTRAGLGPRSEGQSYFVLAERLGLLDGPLHDRTVTEQFARDSLENLLFSMCRFRQITGRLPQKVVVVGFPFKARRFVELHRRAVSLSPTAFEYISVSVPGFDQDGLVDDAYGDFVGDLYGCGAKLAGKRRSRNPYHEWHGYRESCPELSSALTQCVK